MWWKLGLYGKTIQIVFMKVCLVWKTHIKRVFLVFFLVLFFLFRLSLLQEGEKRAGVVGEGRRKRRKDKREGRREKKKEREKKREKKRRKTRKEKTRKKKEKKRKENYGRLDGRSIF